MKNFELHGDHTLEDAARTRELFNAYNDNRWRAGSAEPWVVEVLCALLRANNTRVAIEIGGFQGYTSVQLAQALESLPHATTLTVCEIDTERACDVQLALGRGTLQCRTHVVCGDSLRWIPTLPDESVDFVWLDGNHEKGHVFHELQALWPKLARGGLICGHDVFGSCDLQDVFRAFPNSVSLDLPRLGPAGGIGIIQRPR